MKVKKTKFEYFEISTLENDGAVNKAIFQDKLWEPHIIKYIEKNHNTNEVFIDAGSNFGWHSLVASKYFRHVHSFEPQSLLCKLQNESIIDSNISNISIHNVALGESEYDSTLIQAFYDYPGFNTGIICIGQGGENVKVKSLDSYNFTNVHTIKIDVQCFEDKLLEGSIKLINSCKPNLIVEMECKVEQLFSILRNLNYYCFYLEYEYPVDHIFIHYSKLKEFRAANSNFIFPHTQSNRYSRNIENGVFEKLNYDR